MSDINLNPIALENHGYDYFKKDDHEFEEIIYLIYKNEISHGDWKGKYDTINWLDKVGERGRDCTLHFKEKNTGVIQCKHSRNNMNAFQKNDCIKEICKFLLHWKLDKSLIHDINEFTYYLTVSSKFTEDAQLLLTSFKSKVLDEPDLDKQIKSVLKNNIKLNKSFTFEEAKEHLYSALACLNVKMVIASDIDLLLNKEYNTAIISRFFAVKTVYVKETEFSVDQILKNFTEASVILSEYKNNFEGVYGSHIARTETNDLLNWIKTPLPEKHENIALLVGSPGAGKSVILKDLYTDVSNDKIPVLGIKADSYTAISINNLKERINLVDSFDRLFSKLTKTHNQIVVLIDQIDALSQTNSAKGEFLATYRQLINILKKYHEVRIVISIRTYELDYDFDFTSFKTLKKINVSDLSKDQVKKVIDNINGSPISLSDSLYEVLKTPYNLDTFCRIYNKNVDLNKFNSTTDLYRELWEQKVNSLNNPKLKDFIYSLAILMYRNQDIAIKKQIYTDKYYKEIQLLLKNNLLVEKKEHLLFFHQTFYDFVYAKQFCESNKDVIKYLKQNWQGLKVRSSFKMILAFYRDTNINIYSSILNKIIKGRNIRYHIKLLLINILASEPNPKKREIEIVNKFILNDKALYPVFLKSINSIKWFQLIVINQKPRFNLIKENHFNNILYSLIIKHLPEHREIIIQYCLNNREIFSKDDIVRFLYNLKEWDFPEAYELLKTTEKHLYNNEHFLYDILIAISSNNLNKALEIFNHCFDVKLKEIEYENCHLKLDFGYDAQKFINHIYSLDFEVAFKYNFRLVEALVKNTEMDYPKTDNELIMDHAFCDSFSYDEDKYEFLLNILNDKIKKIACDNLELFKSSVSIHFNTKFRTILNIVLRGINSNPVPYIEFTYKIIIHLNHIGILKSSTDELTILREILGKSYGYFNSKQKLKVDSILKELAYAKDSYIANWVNPRKAICRYGYTQYKFLQKISSAELKHNSYLYKRFQELNRRFGIIEDKIKPRHGMAHMVGAPLTSEAYKYMDITAWRKSMLKYNDSYERDLGSGKGGKQEHSQAFRREVKDNPKRFINFIKEIIPDTKFHDDYIVNGVEGIIESDKNVKIEECVYLVKAIISHRTIANYDIRRIIWMINSLIIKDYIDDDFFEYLKSILFDSEDECGIEGTDDLITKGINTNCGAAAKSLTVIDFDKNYAESIFSALELASKTKTEYVKAAILYRLAHLNHYDTERNFQLFLSLTNSNNPHLLKSSIWSLQYFRNKYIDRLTDFFKKTIQMEILTKDITTVLTVGWIGGTEKCFTILKEFYPKIKEVKYNMLFVAHTNFKKHNDDIDSKCLEIFRLFLNEKDKEIAQRYSYFFTKLPKYEFINLYPTLVLYSKSNVCRVSPGYFNEYLMKCANSYPVECLKLLANIKPDRANDSDEEEYYYKDKGLNVIVHAYNGLLQQPKPNKRRINYCLNLFDKSLKESKNQNLISKVIEEVDR